MLRPACLNYKKIKRESAPDAEVVGSRLGWEMGLQRN